VKDLHQKALNFIGDSVDWLANNKVFLQEQIVRVLEWHSP